MSPVIEWQPTTSGQSCTAFANASVGMRPRFSSFTVTKARRPRPTLPGSTMAA